MKTIIIRKGECEDLRTTIRQIGRCVLITTERAAVARAVSREITEYLSRGEKDISRQKPAIGFQI